METKGKIILSPYKLFLVGLLGFAQGVIFLLPYLSGPFYTPMLDMLQCTNEQLGSLYSIMGIVMWITLIPGGWVADKFDTRKVVSISLVLTGAAGFSLMFSTSFTYYYIVWGLFALISNLLYWSAAIKFVRIITTTDEQGKAYGYTYAMNGLATALFGAVGVWLLAQATNSTDGLKSVIACYSALNVVCGVLIWIFFKSVKMSDGSLLGEEKKPTFIEMLSVLKLKQTWIFSIMCFCLYSLQTMIISYFTPFFTDVLGLSESIAAGIYVAISFIGVLSPVVLGTFADRLGSVIKTIIMCMIVLIVFLTVLLAINKSIPIWGAVIIDVCAVAIAGGIYSIQFSAFDEVRLDRKITGSCVAMASMIGYSADVFLWTLFGSFLDNYGNDGYSYIFGCLLGAAIVGLAGAYLLSKWSKKDPKLDVA